MRRQTPKRRHDRKPLVRRKRRDPGSTRMADLPDRPAHTGPRLAPLEQRGAESRNPSPDQGQEARRDSDVRNIEEKGRRPDDFGSN